LKVIVVDDHPFARVAMRTLLENAGFTITHEVDDGANALKLIKRYKPDVVILDVDIPTISGIEVVERLRRNLFTGIIIVVSAKNELFYGKQSADAGANGFVGKKEGVKHILSAINAAQNGYSYFPFTSTKFIGSHPSEQDKLEQLSAQEVRVMRYLLNGLDMVTIASKMGISNKTVSTYKGRLMEKLECKSLIDLYSFGNRNNIS